MRFAVLAGFLSLGVAHAEWGAPVSVRHMNETCVTYRAKVARGHLIVEANVAEGWHTFAMDNELRAAEALAGKQSLGVDGPTQITLPATIEAVGPWRQSAPTDFSKPELRWFSWGFEDRAVFAAKLKNPGRAAGISLKGQACSETTCKNVDIVLEAPLDDQGIELDGLETVRE